MRTIALRSIKWGWLLLVLGATIYYLATHSKWLDELRLLPAHRVLLAAICLCVAKVLLVEVSRGSAQARGETVSFPAMFYINSLTQLGKYLPGGIWHFVGRAGFYHGRGFSLKVTAQVMIIENIWLVSSALCAAAVYCAAHFLDPVGGLLVGGGVVGIGLLLVYLPQRGSQRGSRNGSTFRLRTVVQIWGLLVAVWTLMGLAFALLVPAAASSTLVLRIGAFALSWALGYLAVFAPSGLGVRETVLVAVLAATFDTETILMAATLNRVLWVIVELGLGVLAKLTLERVMHFDSAS